MNKAGHSISLLLLSLSIAVSALTGCAVKQVAFVAPDVPAVPEAGRLLAYQMPDNTALRYRVGVEHEHSMEVMGRSQGFGSERVLEFSLARQGTGIESMPLTVTVDSLHLKLDTPRGVSERDIGEVQGKSFGMTLSPLGEESDFSMVEAVAYEMQPAGSMNVSADLEAFFPNLPGKELRIGEGWRASEYLTDTAFNSGKKIKLESIHTLQGFEAIDGIECARIRTTVSGVLEQVGEKLVRAPDMRAGFDGDGVWFFDYRQGLLVKADLTIRGRGEMETGGGHGPPARMNQTMTITTQRLP